jgi:hypothetical protein
MTAGDDVAEVSFRDLDDRAVRLGEFHGRTLVLVGGGRGSIRQAMRWGESLDGRLFARMGVRTVPVVFIDGLPVLVPRRLVRESIKRFAPFQPLIDWEGKAARALGLEGPDVAHVWVIDPSSVLRHLLVSPFSEAGLAHAERLIAAVNDRWRSQPRTDASVPRRSGPPPARGVPNR